MHVKQLDWLNRMQIQLPNEVNFIITTLETAGHEAYAVALYYCFGAVGKDGGGEC